MGPGLRLAALGVVCFALTYLNGDDLPVGVSEHVGGIIGCAGAVVIISLCAKLGQEHATFVSKLSQSAARLSGRLFGGPDDARRGLLEPVADDRRVSW